jgi:hypothetical protein
MAAAKAAALANLRQGSQAPQPAGPGWGKKLVLRVLAEANSPLRGYAVKAAAEQIIGRKLSKAAVRHALLLSQAAQSGQIIRLPDGRNALTTGGLATPPQPKLAHEGIELGSRSGAKLVHATS